MFLSGGEPMSMVQHIQQQIQASKQGVGAAEYGYMRAIEPSLPLFRLEVRQGETRGRASTVVNGRACLYVHDATPTPGSGSGTVDEAAEEVEDLALVGAG